MKYILMTIGWMLVTMLLVSVSMGVSYVFPYPFAKVNVIYAAILFMMMRRPRGGIVWVSFLAHFFLELYATTPFGVVVMSGTLSTLFAYWAYQYIFSNRSWYAMAVMSIVTLILYRGLYTVFLFVASLFDESVVVLVRGIAVIAGWEILFTGIVIVLVYMLWLYPKDKRTNKWQWYAS